MDNLNPWAIWLANKASEMSENYSYNRAIWGKAHGASSDFRWLAYSAGFAADNELERQKLTLGAQEQPCDLYFWRYLPETQTYYAGKAYRSRATDATGRSGFLEKQFLELKESPEVPAQVLALLIAPIIKAASDDKWWEQRVNVDWSKDDEYWTLDSEQKSKPTFLEKSLSPTIEKGLQELNSLKTELEHCYARLLAGEKPAALYATKALQAETLATLLLPLDEELAKRVSIAGWIPSDYPDIHKLGENWDIIVLPQRLTIALSPEATKHLQKAEGMVNALLKNNPNLLLPEKTIEDQRIDTSIFQQPKIDLKEIPPANPAKTRLPPTLPTAESLIDLKQDTAQNDLAYPNAEFSLISNNFGDFQNLVNPVLDFAKIINRRDLRHDSPEVKGLRPYFNRGSGFAKVVDEWIAAIKTPPAHVDKEQWEVKIQQLEALAYALDQSETRRRAATQNRKIPLNYYLEA